MTESITSLGKSEEWFWESELRIVWNLIKEKKKIDKERMKAQAMYIACSVWGKNIDSLDKDTEENPNRPMPGRDVPVDADLLRGW